MIHARKGLARAICSTLRVLLPLFALHAWVFPNPSSAQDDAARVLDELEIRLSEAVPVIMNYQVSSSGAFETSLRGDLRLAVDQGGLRAQGSFGGTEQLLHLDFANGVVRGGNGASQFNVEGSATAEALVLGLTRMGILHNLARLTAGSPPDHFAGGVDEWVAVSNVEWLDGDPDGPGPIAMGLSFDVVVNGIYSGDASLWLDTRGLPRLRTQTVSFPEGVMEVYEEYSFEAGPGL